MRILVSLNFQEWPTDEEYLYLIIQWSLFFFVPVNLCLDSRRWIGRCIDHRVSFFSLFAGLMICWLWNDMAQCLWKVIWFRFMILYHLSLHCLNQVDIQIDLTPNDLSSLSQHHWDEKFQSPSVERYPRSINLRIPYHFPLWIQRMSYQTDTNPCIHRNASV